MATLKNTRSLTVMLLIMLGLSLFSQSQAEKDLLKTAEKQFESGAFLDALPSFRQLISIAPENKDYNFKYGTCLLYSDEDVSTAVDHLSFACRGGNFADKRAYFYLGKAYHLNYQFADALKAYGDFKTKVDSKTGASFKEVDRLITMAGNGKELLSDVKDIKVLDKTESTVGEFFRNYDLSAMGGSIIKVPEELLSNTDKKRGHSPLMYFPADGSAEIIFSSYGREDHLDLYSVRRTASGGFSTPEKLRGVVNSPFDEDYPFLHSDGRTLYFSSKGHNSMGGYDVFKAQRNLSTGIFESPENLDFAISSPDDDIFYVVDKEKRLAHFASSRGSEQGRLHVYEVAVRSAPLELAIVKGTLVNSKGGNAQARIKVIDANTNEELGTYRSDKAGKYLIDLPGAGKYKFFIDYEDSEVTHTGLVDVPSFGRMRAFEQEMDLMDVSGQEKLVIKNHFDKEPSEDVVTLAQSILKSKAALDVNFEGEIEAEEEITESLSEEELVVRSGYAQGTTITSILETAYGQVTDLESSIEKEEQERDKAYARAVEMASQAEEKSAEADALYQRVQATTDPGQKEELILETSIRRSEAEEYTRQAEIAHLLASDMNAIIVQKVGQKQEYDLRNTALENALQSGDSEQAISILTSVKEIEDRGVASIDALETATKMSLDKSRTSDQVMQRLESIRNERDRTSASIKTKETLLERTSKQKEKEVVQAELTALKSELEDLDAQLEKNKTKLSSVQSESEVATGSVDLLEKIRLGQEPELLTIQPLSIPAGGLDVMAQQLDGYKELTGAIRLSDEEIAQIIAKRPELLERYSTTEVDYLEAVTADIDFTASVATTSSSDSTTADEQSSLGEEGENTSNVDETEVQESVSSTSQEDTSPGQTIIETSADIEFSQLSSEEVLGVVIPEYSSARADIEDSDMPPVDRAQALIDLNKASVQQISERIEERRSSADFEESESVQQEVARLEALNEELKTEMLAMAKETEGLPSITTSTELASEEQVLSNDLERISEESGLSDEIAEHYSEVAKINSDTSTTEVVQLSARMKAHTSFNRELQSNLSALDPSDESTSAKAAAIQEMMGVKDKEIARDVASWQEVTGVTLSPAEMVVATRSASYLAERSLTQAQGANPTAIAYLNSKAAHKLIQEGLDQQVLDAIPLTDDQLALLETLDSESTASASSTTDEIEEETSDPQSQDVAEVTTEEETEELSTAPTIKSKYDLQVLAESKDWANQLFTTNRNIGQALDVHNALRSLESREASEMERMSSEIEAAEAMKEVVAAEMMDLEEDMRELNSDVELSEPVSQLIERAYLENRHAQDLRNSASTEKDIATQHDLLNKAMLLELSALNRMTEAASLQGHIKKGRSMDSFKYEDAIVIDQGLYADEDVASIIADPQRSEETSSLESTVSSESSSSDVRSEESESETATDVEDGTEETLSDVVESLATTESPADDTEELDEQRDAEFEGSEDGTRTSETDSGEMLAEESPVAENTSRSSSIPAVELEKAPAVEAKEDIDRIPVLASSAAIQTYPKLSAELTTENILPILSFEEEMQLIDAEVQNFSYRSDQRSASLDQGEVEELDRLELDKVKSEAYVKELQGTITEYRSALAQRKTRLAEVVDVDAEELTTVQVEERARLTAEIQVISSYLEQAENNERKVQEAIVEYTGQKERILDEAAQRTATVEVPAEELVEELEEDTEDEALETSAEVSSPKEEVVSAPVTPVFDEFGIPDVLTEDLFAVDTERARSRTIPIDVELPEGVIYQVQVGAFRNPIPEDHFAEFDPIMGERLNSGITRYKVGLFTARESAVVARDRIRAMGYADAFVVKYENGERGKADLSQEPLAQNSSTTSPVIASETAQRTDPESTSSSSTERPSESPSTNTSGTSDSGADPTAYYESYESAAPATQVEIIDGLFYTVQVGVYSKPVTSSSIYDITPLNSELLSNGLIKYTSGIFDEMTIAEQWKDKVIQKGVADAFITAYHNGKRVTLSQAALLLADKGTDVLADLEDMDELHTDRQGQAVWELVSTSELFAEEVRDQVEFKIRMGPYFERIPDKDVKVILDFEDNIDYSRREDGAIVYTTKGGMSYEEAQKWRGTFLESGVTNANIIALQNGEEISVKQALDFLLK